MNEDEEMMKRDIDSLLSGRATNSNELLVKLAILKAYDLDKFMDTMYTVLAENPNRMVEARGEIDQKLQAINALIDHYKDQEIYEKCQVLQNMSDAIVEKSWEE